MDAGELMVKVASKWPAANGPEFQTKNWQITFVSKIISPLKGDYEDNDYTDVWNTNTKYRTDK